MTTRRPKLSDKQVKALPVKAERYAKPDPELVGHYVRVMPSGAKSFVAVARDPYGKQVWATIESTDVIGIDESRERAREIIKRVKVGKPAVEPTPAKPESFEVVAVNWLKRWVEKKGLLSQPEIERCLNKYVYPHWRDREFVGIRRGDVTRLLDHLEDEHGARQADIVLAIIRKIGNWHATRDETYESPFVKGMGRAASTKRDRMLDDDEIRAVWRQAEANGTFGGIVRLALLTAQRREKIAAMAWDDVSIDGTWTIPMREREKGVGGALVLPESAVEIIRAQHRIKGNPYVFPGRGAGHFNGFSPCKRAFDKKLPPMKAWSIHDLRRTARSLMSRAGVSSDIAERVLGHAIKGVEGVYDVYGYVPEKADALRRLASLINTITNPPAAKAKVLPMRAAS
jgi:Phage integrase family